MEIKIKSYSSQTSLLSSILFFIFGAILWKTADDLLNVVSIIIGTILAISATVSLIIYFVQSRNGIPKKGNLIYGIIAIIIAAIFIFCSDVVEQAIRFIIGGWILLTGIIRLITVLSMNKKDKTFFQLLIVAALLIFVCIYTIVKDLFGLDYIGIIIMVYSAIEIIGYILYSKDKPQKEDLNKEGTTTLLVPENTEDSDKKEVISVKEAKALKRKERKQRKKEIKEAKEAAKK